MGAPPRRALAELPEAVSLGVERARLGGRVGPVEDVALLRGEQEDEPVGQPKELLVEPLRSQRLLPERVAQRAVLLVRHEALAEHQERLGHPLAELIASARPLLPPRLAPQLQRALGGGAARAAEAGLVDEEPEGGEVGVAVFGEDAREVGLDPCGAREAGVVAHHTERETVAHDAPEGLVGRVEKLLHEPKGAPTVCAVAEGHRRGVEPDAGGRDDHRDLPREREVTDGEHPPLARQRVRRPERDEAEHLPKHVPDELLRERRGVAVLREAAGELLVVGLGDAPEAPDLVAEVEPLLDAVVRGLLVPRGELGDAGEPVGREEPSLDGERFEGDLRGVAGATRAHDAPSTGGRRR